MWQKGNRRRAMKRRRSEVELQNRERTGVPTRAARVGTPVFSRFCNICRPLRGLTNIFLYRIPGLTPGATLCRRLRRLIEQLIPAGIIFSAGLFFLVALLPSIAIFAQVIDLYYSYFLHT